MEITRLIERCKQGDADALAELYKAYALRMRGVCRRYVSDEQTVDDVLHDSFLIILTSFHRLRDSKKADAWMMAITRNVASKYKEHLTAISTVSIEDANVADWLAEECEERSVRGVPLDDVMQMVEQLPKGYGKVFRLSVFEGMSHKEIADMLSIEPHSSSSQLARAKRMLRTMMQSRWSLLLLLLLLPLSLLLLRRDFNDSSTLSGGMTHRKGGKKETVVSPTRTELPSRSMVNRTSYPASTYQRSSGMDSLQHLIVYAVDSVCPNDTAQILTDAEQADSTLQRKNNKQFILPLHEMANTYVGPSWRRSDDGQQWSLQLAYTGGFDKQSIYNQPFVLQPAPSSMQSLPSGEPVAPAMPSSIDNWSDYALYLANNPDAASAETRSLVMRIALSNANRPGEDKILRSSHHAMPITWSLTLKRKFNSRWGLETGLNYTKLNSEFEMGEDGNKIAEQQAIHYLGIPVKGLFTLYGNHSLSLYSGAGMTVEIPLPSSLHSSYFVNGQFEARERFSIRAPWQFSTSVGIGVQYQLTPSIGLFVEPSLQYFLPSGSEIETYRTEHPFVFSLPVGIRITINE